MIPILSLLLGLLTVLFRGDLYATPGRVDPLEQPWNAPVRNTAPLAPGQSLSGVELLKRIDSLVSFPEGDFSAEYLMVQTKPGEGTTTTNFVIFRRDAEEKYLILILSPPQDKGKGYLKIGNNLWFYDPADRRFTFTSAKDRFQNSNARNSDFTRSSFAIDYRITSSRQEKLGKFDCTVLDMEATSDEVTFPRTILWVDNTDLLVRKKEDYSLSNQLLRTTAIPTYQRFHNRFVPVTIHIVDHLRGRTMDGKFQSETTRITISRPSLAPQPDSLYTKGYLERLGR
ncbi:MAG: outer membrane lipoprotein-sorting protein [Spirochaetes bacterium]|nr:outer membrane lipoprotein-sorting protein [Spirochaetota bacterium]